MGRRVLFMLSQMPQDPASGAARNLRSICETLADGGFEVRALGSTATEIHGDYDPVEVLRNGGFAPEAGAGPDGHTVYSFDSRGIPCRLLDVGQSAPVAWIPDHGIPFDKMLKEEVDRFAPDILVTYGGMPQEVHRRLFVRERGAAVVFGLQNLSYLNKRAWVGVDAVFTASQFTTDLYKQHIGLESRPLIAPFDLEDVVAGQHKRRFLTFINPNIPKGVMVFARLAEELCKLRPEMPILVIEARGDAASLHEAGQLGGFDLARHKNLNVAPSVSYPRTIFEVTRALVVPSVWAEPFGRVAPEALLNAIPPVVSNRGGLPDAANAGGFVLGLPHHITPRTKIVPSAEEIRDWIDVCLRLMDDNIFYAEACERAREAGQRFMPDALRHEILTFFARVVKAPGRTLGPFPG